MKYLILAMMSFAGSNAFAVQIVCSTYNGAQVNCHSDTGCFCHQNCTSASNWSCKNMASAVKGSAGARSASLESQAVAAFLAAYPLKAQSLAQPKASIGY